MKKMVSDGGGKATCWRGSEDEVPLLFLATAARLRANVKREEVMMVSIIVFGGAARTK